MKPIFISFSLLFCVLVSQANQDSVPAFRSIKWGANLDSIFANGKKVEFVNSEDPGFQNAYIIPNDDPNIGNVRMNKIYYIFNEENRFSKVVMEGRKMDTEEIDFVVQYKFGEHQNSKSFDGGGYKQWIIREVTITLVEHQYHKFELTIESDWEIAEAYRKNTNVDDF